MKIIRPKILNNFPGLVCGMSTTDGGVSEGKFGLNLSFNVQDSETSVKENRKRFFSLLGILESQVAFTQQKHTSNIAAVGHAGLNENCDALHTNSKNVFLAISIADCTPVLLYDKKQRVAAGIHAGWRGAAHRISEKMIKEMQIIYGSNVEDIIAFIGPAAGKCCYEVEAEVAEQFPKECSSKKENGKYLLDVKSVNMMQLLENGVLNSNIEMNQDCTIHNTIYHSFRRDGNQSGRMFAIIGMKE
ncbi:MAG: peptidoglycan editing factor PgeF [Bacteroidota bacterium]|nr:peptidoglycan editing factor PgeF [Bacteroidota bacterium]